MTIGWHRETKLVIDQQAIIQNVKNQLLNLPSDCELFAVVKANGYGHGSVEVAKAAQFAGAAGFCVAILDEAIELREAGITEPILILSPINLTYIAMAIQYNLSVTVTDLNWIIEATHHIEKLNLSNSESLNVHLKLDTGMGRLGFQETKDILEVLPFVDKNFITWEGIFTHYATADEKDEVYFNGQYKSFMSCLEELPYLPKYIHAENSSGAMWHHEPKFNMIRFGVAMYGLSPSQERELPYPLIPALSLKTELIQVKKINKGSGVGYGTTYRTEYDEWIGTIPIGYADGWHRSLQSHYVIVEGQYCEIIGRICMDICMIRLPKEFPLGTEVTLIGSNKGATMTVDEIAKKMRTINYEVVTGFSERIPRVYNQK